MAQVLASWALKRLSPVGQLDDLLVGALGIMLALRLIPAPLMQEFREAALSRSRPRSPIAAAAVIGIWILGATLLGMVWLRQEP